MDKKQNLLLVDDEPFALDILEGYLATEGYDIVLAASAAEALNKIETKPPDAILLDIMMPEIDGLEVCRRLKADPRWQHIPIILVTALGGKEDLARGLEAGADDFIHKPVHEQELRARVRSMLRLKKQYDQLQENLQLREDMVHMILHDMKTPLTAISGFSELLLMRKTSPPEDLKDIKKIHSQAARLSSFLNDLLITAKMEKGQISLSKIPVDVNKLIHKVKRIHKIAAQLKKMEINIDSPAEAPPITLDINLFQRVLDNLLSNAIKFSPPNSEILIQVEYFSAQSSKPAARVKVADHGAGISEEFRKRIFNKFEVARLKSQGVQQIGLGLAFCKMVLEAHQGQIYVESNQPTGSVFVVEV